MALALLTHKNNNQLRMVTWEDVKGNGGTSVGGEGKGEDGRGRDKSNKAHNDDDKFITLTPPAI